MFIAFKKMLRNYFKRNNLYLLEREITHFSSKVLILDVIEAVGYMTKALWDAF